MDLQSIFISNLKRIRKEKHITQEKLAELCQTDVSYIGQIEIQKRFPSLSLIEKMAEALEIEPYLLFKESSNNQKEEEIHKLGAEIINEISPVIYKVLSETIDA